MLVLIVNLDSNSPDLKRFLFSELTVFFFFPLEFVDTGKFNPYPSCTILTWDQHLLWNSVMKQNCRDGSKSLFTVETDIEVKCL